MNHLSFTALIMTPLQIHTTVFLVTVAMLLTSPTLAGKNRHDEGEALSELSKSQGEQGVKVDPEQTSLSTGKETQFKCSAHNGTSVYWTNQNGSRIQDLNDTRFSDAEGWLNISSLREEDTGDYTCLTTDGHHNATVHLNVYVMPDYFLESMIVVAINVALAILFFSCLIYKTIQGRRETAKYKKYKEANVEVTVTDDKQFKPHNKHLDI